MQLLDPVEETEADMAKVTGTITMAIKAMVETAMEGADLITETVDLTVMEMAMATAMAPVDMAAAKVMAAAAMVETVAAGVIITEAMEDPDMEAIMAEVTMAEVAIMVAIPAVTTAEALARLMVGAHLALALALPHLIKRLEALMAEAWEVVASPDGPGNSAGN